MFENCGLEYEVHTHSWDSNIRLTYLNFKAHLPSWQLSIQRHHTVLVSSASPRSLPPNDLIEQTWALQKVPVKKEGWWKKKIKAHFWSPENLACSALILRACNSVSYTIDKETEHKELFFCESLRKKLGQRSFFSSFENKKSTGGWQSAGKHGADTSEQLHSSLEAPPLCWS